jgi:hypothetical protein
MGVKGRSLPVYYIQVDSDLTQKYYNWLKKLLGTNTLAYSNVEKSFVMLTWQCYETLFFVTDGGAK